MKLTIIIPAYNEEKTIAECLRRVVGVALGSIKKDIVVVNDGSKDGTKREIKKIKDRRIKLINKPVNEGKGAAIADGLRVARGDIIIVQDADLEYDPQDYLAVLGPIIDGKADVVFGSRFVGSQPRRVMFFWHWAGNIALTFLTNLVTNLNLSDMETCYKAFTKEVASKLNLSEKRFGFEPELTVKVAKMGVRIYEVGISYSGRSYAEGKKINWKDGLWALWCLVKYGVLAV